MSAAIIMEPNVGTLTLGTSGEIACQLVTGMITSEQPENITEAMCGSVITYGSERFFLDVDYFQDWHSAGMSKYLWDHAGQTVAYQFSPMSDGTPKMAGNLRVKRPAAFGGPSRVPARDRIRMALTDVPTVTVDA